MQIQAQSLSSSTDFEVVQSHIGGLVFNLRADRADQDRSIIEEVFVKDCYKLRVLKHLIPAPKVIVDIGGHIGAFGLLAKSIWPQAQLIAIEPNRISSELYRRNLADNNFSQAQVLTKAVSYDPASIYLLDGGGSTGGCVLKPAAEAQALNAVGERPGHEKYTIIDSNVEAITIEQLIEQFSIKTISICKWDCEGAEIPSLARLSSNSSVMTGCVLGEYHCSGGFSEFTGIIQRAYPHLPILGGLEPGSIGPFWGIKSPIFSCYVFFWKIYRSLKRVVSQKK